MVFYYPLSFICLFFAYSNAKMNVNFSIKYAPVVQFLPHFKQHHIVVLNDTSEIHSLYAIDFSPLFTPNKNIKLLLNQNIPAEIRIRPMEHWSLYHWYNTPTANINEIKNGYIREVVISGLCKWEDYSKKITSSNECLMNLYKLNCRHFSNFLVNELKNNYSSG